MGLKQAGWLKKSPYRNKRKHFPDCGCNTCFKRALRENHIYKKKTKAPQNYFKYINSIYWLKRKETYYKNHAKLCQACGTNKYIDLHHLTYNILGLENDNDLICLCRDCHAQLHKQIGSSKNMYRDTYKFIKTKQNNIKRLLEQYNLTQKSN